MPQDFAPRRLSRGAERRDRERHFLKLSATLLLEYNVGAELLKQQVERVAGHLDVSLVALVGYREVTLVTAGDRDLIVHVAEYRINAAVIVEVLRVFDDLRNDQIDLDEATRRLEDVEQTVPRYGRWLVTLMFGLAVSALARLLGADSSAIAIVGVSASVSVIARQELARWHVMMFAQPFAAGLIGAVLGGVIIRLGWSSTAGLCLVVPCLMLVPGPHLINGVDDVLGNHMQAGIGRLALAASVLLAAALGALFGDWLVAGLRAAAGSSSQALPALMFDVVLAGGAAGGFAIYYNTPRRVLWISILCGMVGHGVRYICVQASVGVAIATLCGYRLQLPFSAVAFAGAVPMMPGTLIYESIANAVRLSVETGEPDSLLAGAIVAVSLRAGFVVGCIVVGLVIGACATRLATTGSRDLSRV